jgi:hypothetical protein
LDEGAYLTKGLLFVTGEYAPFQDYGPLTNHMPLSFLIYGYIQQWFGEGLRTGRYFALILGVLMLLGIWIVMRRMGDERWSALGVWMVAINPATSKMYSLATTQVIIAAMLVWVLVATLGDDRSHWQIIAGSTLAGIMMLTRINLTPVLLTLVVYIFWQHGRKAGILACVFGFGIVLIGHTFFWPDILRLWAAWLPSSITSFLDPWRLPEATRLWSPAIPLNNRVLSFLQGMRFHFASIIAVFTALILWPKRDSWRGTTFWQSSVFLVVLFGFLFVEHLVASLGLSYCVYCFPVYLSFFSQLGLVLFVVAFSSLQKKPSLARQFTVIIFILVFATALGYGAFGEIGEWLVRLRIPRLKTLISTREFQAGIPIWDFLQSRLGIGFEISKRIIPSLVGLAIGIGVLGFGFWLSRRKLTFERSFSLLTLISFLGVGLLFSPTPALGNGFQTYDCGGDVLSGYEATGAYLAHLIPPGSKVYWRGGNSAVPLLYLPDTQVYLPQLNGDYTLYEYDDDDLLLKFGLWSDSLSKSWLREADFILVEARLYEGDLKETVESLGLETLPATPSPLSCRSDSQILVFKSK